MTISKKLILLIALPLIVLGLMHFTGITASQDLLNFEPIIDNTQPSVQYGLKSSNNDPITLLSLEISAIIEGPYAHIEYIQQYKNPNAYPIETEYYFPRTDTSIFYEFKAIFLDKVIVGKIFEKQPAKEMYEWNVAQGKTAAYSERNASAPNIMKILVGNIPPYGTITIKFSIIQPLEVGSNLFALNLVSELKGRYASVVTQTSKIHDLPLERVRYNDWRVYVEVKSDSPFEYVINPSHHIEPELVKDQHYGVYKAIWKASITPDRNFIIYFKLNEVKTHSVILSEHPKHRNDYVALINFARELNSFSFENLRGAIMEHIIGSVAKVGRIISEFIFDDENVGEKEKSVVTPHLKDIESKVKCIDKDGKETFTQEGNIDFSYGISLLGSGFI